MQDLILNNIALIILIPLWIFLIIMCGRFFSVYVNRRIVSFLTLLSSIMGAVVCFAGLKYLNQTLEFSYRFIKIRNFSIDIGLYIDKLSLVLALILFIVSFAVQLFSISYMKKEPKNYRFFALLNLFNFGMSAFLFSPNLFQMYVFWEIIGIVSYLFIGFDYKKVEKSSASKKVFIINRVGDTALIGSIILTSYFMYSYTENPLLASLPISEFNSVSTFLRAYTSTPIFLIICGLFITGAAVKSAQYPFHVWLQDAMEAKLPVSALLHSATMVTAGAYLIMRIMPFLTLHKYTLYVLLLIGSVSLILCSILACAEKKPKKILAYSTSANLGIIFIALGLSNIKIALMFLTVHAFLKSMLFLSLPKEDKKVSVVRFGFLIIGCLSLGGVLLSGVPAKELVYIAVTGHSLIGRVFLLSVFISTFYIVRLIFLVYRDSVLEKKINYTETFSCLILLSVSIIIYFVLREEKYILSYPYYFAIAGLISVVILYYYNFLTKLSITKLSEIFINNFIPYCYEKISVFANFIESNILSCYKPVIFVAQTNVKLINWIEENVMNRAVRIVSEGAKNLSKLDMLIQSKNIQSYNAYAFIIITAIVALVIISYTFVISYIGG